MSFFDNRSKFSELLCKGDFLVSAELTPPRHYDLRDFMRKAELVSEFVDIVQINDHLLSKARINNIIPGQQCKIADIETIIQFSLIHKNKIAIQGDLLALAASGLHNILILGGYPCRIGSDPDATDVLDLDAIEAIKLVHDLTTEGRLFNGDVISPPPFFHIGTVDFPCGKSDLKQGIDRLERKIDAGASYVQIQSVFELGKLYRWMDEIMRRGLEKRAKFLGAVFPFENVERLHALSQIPGLEIPNELVHRMENNDCRFESLKITRELTEGIRQIEAISGIHIRSIGAEEWVPNIVNHCGLKDDVLF